MNDPWEKLNHKLVDARAAIDLSVRRKFLIDAQELLMELFLETRVRQDAETPKIDLKRVQQGLVVAPPVTQTDRSS